MILYIGTLMILIMIIFLCFRFSIFISRDYDPVYWDSYDPNNDDLSVFVIHNILFLGIMSLYIGTLMILMSQQNLTRKDLSTNS